MIRTFKSGANRNTDKGKLDYEAFISPIVIKNYAEYMYKHAHLEDGTIREGDNWQKLFGEDHYSVCMKSLMRHIMDLWLEHRGYKSRDGIEEALNGIIFNAMAYNYKRLKENERKTIPSNVK